MSPYKRKRDELDDSDDEEPSFGRQILPVANLPEDFNGIPTDGMQYLFTVRRDARHLPHTTRVANPYESAEPPTQPPPPHDHLTATHPALPSAEWRTSFETHFRNFRENLTQPTIHVHFTPQEQNLRLMPDMRERDLWWAFLAGRPESDWNPPKKLKQNQNSTKRHKFGKGMRGFSDDPDFGAPDAAPPEIWHINDEGEVELALRVDPSETLPTPSGTPAPQEHLAEGKSAAENFVDKQEPPAWKPREPTPSLLRHIDQRMSLHLLMYFTHWINQQLSYPSSSQLTETHARWIFVLLSRIEDHIAADDMSQLRNLARACLGLLKVLILQRSMSVKLEEQPNVGHSNEKCNEVMAERSCWIIISAVVGIWGQRDLWMDAEAMLASLESC